MAYGKAALGKIFISHSSVDKAWVRRVEKRVRDAGYDTWLDEKEIEVGDALAAKISQGVRDAKVVIVVVSAASLASKWLRYELDIATERMISGHCRVLPVLIDDVDVPPEIAGRLYADMRPYRRGGFAKLLRVLDLEADRYPEPTAPLTMDSPDSWIRQRAYENVLSGLADGGWFSGSMQISAVRDIDFEGITISGRDVIVDVVSVYSQRGELSEHDYDDWMTRVCDELNETCGLLITEKPPSDKLVELLNIEDRIGSAQTGGLLQPSGSLVLVDLSEDLSDAQAQDILRRAHQYLKNAIGTATPPLIDPDTLARTKD